MTSEALNKCDAVFVLDGSVPYLGFKGLNPKPYHGSFIRAHGMDEPTDCYGSLEVNQATPRRKCFLNVVSLCGIYAASQNTAMLTVQYTHTLV